MSKTKTQRDLENISKLKERFQGLSTEKIVSRLVNFDKTNAIATAYKEILKERGITDYLSLLE